LLTGENMNEKHVPVLSQEVAKLLNLAPGKNYIDATLGFGGHSDIILQGNAPDGRVLGIDQDQVALDYAKQRLAGSGERFSFAQGNFEMVATLAKDFPVTGGILADIGVSSVQLDDAGRGFSFTHEGPLDMRMDKGQTLTASEVVNTWEETRIVRVIRDYGEERFASRIAHTIVEARAKQAITTTLELAAIVSSAIPRKFWPKGINPATRTFQGIRIAVNNELGVLQDFLPAATDLLQPGARLAVITFHSLEDRIVKDYFRARANPCTCPPEFPKCICDKVADIKIITKKPVTATEEEIGDNPRSRSAKLRVIEKL
jgi:16S rRNA (cytosine1402-N4)-methyltransferase